MFRYAFALKMKEGKSGEFHEALGKRWMEITAFLDEMGYTNFSMWKAEDLVLGYYESDVEKNQKKMEEALTNWNVMQPELFQWISSPMQEMRLMYQDYGVVRDSKELIRHRVFMTKLKGNFEEEYKRRHDGLVEARNGKINPGPDSNFTIWNAGGYIMGYDEIDTTMEHIPTEAEKKETIAWETKMLEIMEWITNDVDWITGEHHAQVRRICAHA